MLQLESFFDLNRLHTAWGAAAPNLARLQNAASRFGRLEVPCWGANTIRTEFAVLTGIEVKRLGLDQYNPYDRFARAPVDALGWDMRRRGDKTVCIHPFDLRFYGRAKVMPQLGFEKLLGPHAFSRPAEGGYVTDQAIIDQVAKELQRQDRPGFIFAITIAAHGPWKDAGQDSGGIGAYLDAARRMDDVLPQLQSLADAHDALLVLYGDHQPSLPKAFGSIGFSDPRTDYLIYDPQRPAAFAAANRKDVAAHELRRMIFQHLERDAVRADSLVAS